VRSCRSTSPAGSDFRVFAYSVVDGLYQGASTVVRLPAGYVADRIDRPKWVALSGYVLSALTRIGLLAATACPRSLLWSLPTAWAKGSAQRHVTA